MNMYEGLAAADYGSFDQQDCPVCDFSGEVFRLFHNPGVGEDGGYDWACPTCGAENVWEGFDFPNGNN